jgi:hypothetical protein
VDGIPPDEKFTGKLTLALVRLSHSGSMVSRTITPLAGEERSDATDVGWSELLGR